MFRESGWRIASDTTTHQLARTLLRQRQGTLWQTCCSRRNQHLRKCRGIRLSTCISRMRFERIWKTHTYIVFALCWKASTQIACRHTMLRRFRSNGRRHIPQDKIHTAMPKSTCMSWICDGNRWHVSKDTATTHDIIDVDLAEGVVPEHTGGIGGSRAQLPHTAVIGNPNLAISYAKPPRLVLDSTVPHVTHRAMVIEQVGHPSLLSVKKALHGVSQYI